MLPEYTYLMETAAGNHLASHRTSPRTRSDRATMAVITSVRIQNNKCSQYNIRMRFSGKFLSHLLQSIRQILLIRIQVRRYIRILGQALPRPIESIIHPLILPTFIGKRISGNPSVHFLPILQPLRRSIHRTAILHMVVNFQSLPNLVGHGTHAALQPFYCVIRRSYYIKLHTSLRFYLNLSFLASF